MLDTYKREILDLFVNKSFNVRIHISHTIYSVPT